MEGEQNYGRNGQALPFPATRERDLTGGDDTRGASEVPFLASKTTSSGLGESNLNVDERRRASTPNDREYESERGMRSAPKCDGDDALVCEIATGGGPRKNASAGFGGSTTGGGAGVDAAKRFDAAFADSLDARTGVGELGVGLGLDGDGGSAAIGLR